RDARRRDRARRSDRDRRADRRRPCRRRRAPARRPASGSSFALELGAQRGRPAGFGERPLVVRQRGLGGAAITGADQRLGAPRVCVLEQAAPAESPAARSSSAFASASSTRERLVFVAVAATVVVAVAGVAPVVVVLVE